MNDMSDMTKKSPGWYPNPDSPGHERWWNGSSWSDNTRGDTADVAANPSADASASASAEPVVVAPGEPPQGKGVVAGCLMPVLVLLVVLGIIVGFAAAMKEVWSSKEATSPVATPASDHVVVTYEISGTATEATVMFNTPTGHQQHDVVLPTLDADGNTLLEFEFDHGSYLSLTAHNAGDKGTITCTITADGEVISLNTSSSAFGLVRCDATLALEAAP